MTEQYLVALITAPSEEVGAQIARSLLEQKLAACVNILGPMRSLYWWEGEIQDDREVLLLVKTRSGLLEDQLIPAVQAIHPYQVPEVIALPIEKGLEAYLNWIGASTRI